MKDISKQLDDISKRLQILEDKDKSKFKAGPGLPAASGHKTPRSSADAKKAPDQPRKEHHQQATGHNKNSDKESSGKPIDGQKKA